MHSIGFGLYDEPVEMEIEGKEEYREKEPLFYATLMSRTEEEMRDVFTANPSLHTLFKKAIFEGLRANLERFLSALQRHEIQGYVPFEKYEQEYLKLEIMLTNTFYTLRDRNEQASLDHLVCELAYYSQFCGPQISENVQMSYNSTFNLLQDDGEVEGGIQQLLKRGYGRAALEVVEILLNGTQDERSKAQTIHVLRYIRKVLQDSGVSLPPDPRLAKAPDKWELTFGQTDFPQDKLPSWFEGMLLPHFIEVLNEMQKEARATKNNDLGALLFNNIKERVRLNPTQPEIVPLIEQISQLESHKEHHTSDLILKKKSLLSDKERLVGKFRAEWNLYENAARHLTEMEGRIKALTDQLIELETESQEIGERLNEEVTSEKYSKIQAFRKQSSRLITNFQSYLS